MDDAGNAPFWDALAGKFFGMSFPEADEFNAVHGTQFIADLMPRSPIYVAFLTDAAKAVMGQPHPTGKAALRMLEHEGFAFDRYIDIFDGGPTVTAQTDQIRTIREARSETVREIGDGGSRRMLVSAGRLKEFRACHARVKKLPKKGVMIDREAAELLEIDVGDRSKWPRADAAARNQFRRDRRAVPQLRRAQPRQPRVDPQRRAFVGAARGRAPGPRQDARQPRHRPGPGNFPAPSAPPPCVARRARRGDRGCRSGAAANAMSASAMWAANAATVSPAPDTADGKCHTQPNQAST